MAYVVYEIRNKQNGRVYYGSTGEFAKRKDRHLRELASGQHHNVSLRKDWKKQQGHGFRFKQLQELSSRGLAYAVELSLITKGLAGEGVYNILAGATGGDAYTHHPEYQRLLKRKRLAMQRYFNGLTPEQKRERYGRAGENNNNWRGGHAFHCACGSPIAAQAITCATCRDRTGDKNPFAGKRHSQATKDALAQANQGRLPPNTRKVEVNGKTYESATAAARTLGVVTATVTHRIKSPNPKYAGYAYLT